MFVLDKPHQLAEQGAPAFALGERGLRMNPGGLELEALPLEHRAATLDLVMLIIETAQSLSISIRYNSDLFDAATITRIARHFETLLHHVTTQPDARLNALRDLLAGMDRQQLAAIRRQYKETNLQRLKTARRVAISVSKLGSDGADGYGMLSPPGDRLHLYLNGASSGSKH
jgi:non-ribosomal peptide synthetase component F